MACEAKFNGARGEALRRLGPSGSRRKCMACSGEIGAGSLGLIQPSASLGSRNLPLGKRELCARCGLLGLAYQDIIREGGSR